MSGPDREAIVPEIVQRTYVCSAPFRCKVLGPAEADVSHVPVVTRGTLLLELLASTTSSRVALDSVPGWQKGSQ